MAATEANLDRLKPVLYQLRHSGPSIDAAEARRTCDQMRARGRWAGSNTMRRYEKHSQLSKQWFELPGPTRKFYLAAEKRIANVLAGSAAAVRPPTSADCVKLL